MRKLIERVQADLESFVEQRDDLLMIISCSENDSPIVLKVLQDVEQANSTDVFLLFADDFVEPLPYVDVAIERLREQRKIACDWLAEQDRELLPPVPDALGDVNLSPVRRLGEAMMYARSLVPKEGGHRLVWAMFPQRISNRRAYLDFVSAFAPHYGLKPGMQRLRLIFRDEPDTVALMPELGAAPRLRFNRVDMGPEAIERALREEVEDEELPEERRMTALMQNALLDSAYGRTQDAFTQFRVLLGYYQHTCNYVMQALILNTVADIHLQQNEPKKAQYWYECAVPLAIKSESPVVSHSAVSNLANLAFQQGEFDRAAQLYDYADQLAGKMLYAEGMARAREGRGLSLEQLKDYPGAIASWQRASELSRNTGMTALLKANLEHLARAYQRQGALNEHRAVLTELRQLETGERHS